MENYSVFDIIESLSIIIASGVAIYGIESWRREIKWKRKYELDEEVLSLFYDAKERLRVIRSPFSFGNEGKTRKRGSKELPGESEVLDEAYVTIERYENEKTPFIKLKSVKYKFMAIYGKEAGEPFNKLERLISDLIIASNRLGRRYWQDKKGMKFRSEAVRTKEIEEMWKYEGIIWADYDENDKIEKRMNDIILEVEEICQTQ